MGRASNSLAARWEQPVANIVGGSSTDGATATANASANTKGSWSTDTNWKPTFAWNLMRVTIWNGNTGDFVVDIGADNGSGSVYTICPDLRCPGRLAPRSGAITYLIPLHVPAGRQLALAVACSTGSRAARVSIAGCSAGIGGAQGFARMVALYTPSTSRGVSVDPGATANTKGAWAELTSSSPARVAALMLAVGGAADTARTADQQAFVDIGVGASSSERVLLPDLGFAADQTQSQWHPHVYGPHPVDVPAGTRFAARAQCNVNTAGDRVLDLAAWGFVP